MDDWSVARHGHATAKRDHATLLLMISGLHDFRRWQKRRGHLSEAPPVLNRVGWRRRYFRAASRFSWARWAMISSASRVGTRAYRDISIVNVAMPLERLRTIVA